MDGSTAYRVIPALHLVERLWRQVPRHQKSRRVLPERESQLSITYHPGFLKGTSQASITNHAEVTSNMGLSRRAEGRLFELEHWSLGF